MATENERAVIPPQNPPKSELPPVESTGTGFSYVRADMPAGAETEERDDNASQAERRANKSAPRTPTSAKKVSTSRATKHK